MYATVGASDQIELAVSGTPISVSYYCLYSSSSGLVVVNGIITSGSVPLVPAPVTRINQVLVISIYAQSSSATPTVTIQYDNGSPLQQLIELNLKPTYTLTYTSEGAGFQVYDNIGGRL